MGIPFQIWEFPSSEKLDDWTCFLTKGLNNDRVTKLWLSEIDYQLENNGIIVLTLHAFIIGQTEKIPVLERLFNNVDNRVEFMTPLKYINKNGGLYC